MRKTLLLLGLAAFTAPAAFGQVLISEYVEGSSNNKAIEVQNISNSPIDQTTISIKNYSNGSATPSGTYTLPAGTLNPGDVFVVCNGSSSAPLLAVCDATSGVMSFNGDDAVAVAISGTNVDVVGQIGFDPGTEWVSGGTSTLNQTLQRTNSTANPGTGAYNPATYFSSQPQDTFTGLGVGNASLPVELASFTSSVNNRSARLSWTTASETNNLGFVVEQQTGDAWNAVSNLIAGHGTTTERNDYAFDVNGLTAGQHAFRLRQTDTDGTVHYSATVTVEIAVQDGLALTALGGRGLRVESEASAVVTVVDMLGRRMLVREVSAGTSVVSLDGVGTGVYVVRAESEGKVASTRLVVR